MNKVNSNEEIKYLTLDDINKMYEEAEPADWGYVENYSAVVSNRYQNLITYVKLTKIEIERLPADHSKLLLDFYNLFDENEPYKDKEGTPYRDKLLNDLYYNIYDDDYAPLFSSSNGKGVYKYDVNNVETNWNGHVVKVTKIRTEEIPVLDKNQKIEKLKKSFDIFKRLKERDLVLASMYDRIVKEWRGQDYLAYHDYLGDSDTIGMFINERRLLDYVRYFFAKVNFKAAFFVKDKFPNVKVTENMMAQYLEYKGR